MNRLQPLVSKGINDNKPTQSSETACVCTIFNQSPSKLALDSLQTPFNQCHDFQNKNTKKLNRLGFFNTHGVIGGHGSVSFVSDGAGTATPVIRSGITPMTVFEAAASTTAPPCGSVHHNADEIKADSCVNHHQTRH